MVPFGGDALYAVVKGSAVIYRVLGFADSRPVWVPVAEYVRPAEDRDTVAGDVPVGSGGEPSQPGIHDQVIYSPDYLSLIPTITPWIRVDESVDG